MIGRHGHVVYCSKLYNFCIIAVKFHIHMISGYFPGWKHKNVNNDFPILF